MGEKASAILKSVLCDPEGNMAIACSDEDRRLIAEAIAEVIKLEQMREELIGFLPKIREALLRL